MTTNNKSVYVFDYDFIDENQLLMDSIHSNEVAVDKIEMIGGYEPQYESWNNYKLVKTNFVFEDQELIRVLSSDKNDANYWPSVIYKLNKYCIARLELMIDQLQLPTEADTSIKFDKLQLTDNIFVDIKLTKFGENNVDTIRKYQAEFEKAYC